MTDEFGSGFDEFGPLEDASEPDMTVFESLTETELDAGFDSFDSDAYSTEMVDMTLDFMEENPVYHEYPAETEILPDGPILEPEGLEGGDVYIEYPAETEILPDAFIEAEPISDDEIIFPGETFVESDIPEGGAEILSGPMLDEYGMETAPDADLSVFENLSEEELTAGMESFDPDEYSPEMVDMALDNIAQNPLEDMDAPMTLTRDQTEQWISGNNAIDDTVEAMRDNLRDLGMEDGQEMENIVMTERARMQEELSRNIEGDFSQSYEMPNFQELYGDTIVESDIPEGGAEILPDDFLDAEPEPEAEVLFPGETFVESDIPEGGAEILSGPMLDEYGMETAPDADLSVFENLSEEELTAGMESFDPDEYSPAAVENALDFMEENPVYHEYPAETEILPDAPILEPEGLEGGDTYIEYPAETEILPDEFIEAEPISDDEIIFPGETIVESDIPEGGAEVLPDNVIDTAEKPETAEKPFDYNDVKDQLDKEFIEDAFKDIDCFNETEKLDSLMEPFEKDNWEKLDTQEKLNSMEKLKDYLSGKLELKNPPKFESYTADPGEYGGYSDSTNELLVNVNALESNTEAVDTVAHELWHARQHQLAAEATEPRHFQYQYQFENYIRPEDDFDGYESQLIEQEARAFGSKFQEYLRNKKGA